MKFTLLTIAAVGSTLLVAGETDPNQELKTQVEKEKTALTQAQETNREQTGAAAALLDRIAVTDGKTPAPVAEKKAQIILKNQFNADYNGWGKNPADADIQIAELAGEKVLTVKSDGKSAMLQCGFNVPEGKTLRFTVKMRAQDVVRQQDSGILGTKFLIMMPQDGKMQWPGVNAEAGSFDWRDFSFTQTIPFGTKNIVLLLGLQNAKGTVWFKDLTVEVID